MSNSKRVIYLKKYVRFRKEKDYILVCDLYTLDNYNFDMRYFNEFVKLSTTGMEDCNSDFLNDLKSLELVDENKNIGICSNDDIFSKLLYSENEFFN